MVDGGDGVCLRLGMGGFMEMALLCWHGVWGRHWSGLNAMPLLRCIAARASFGSVMVT